MTFSPTAERAAGLADASRALLGNVPAAVVVVTSYVSGRPWGVTASSFTSVSLSPPTVSVSLFSHTAVVHAIRLQGRMGISVLSADQVAVARAAAAPGAPKFLERFSPESESLDDGAGLPTAGRRWDPLDGVAAPAAPSVHGALGHFDCRISDVVTIGDHDVLFGAVTAVRAGGPDAEALVYARRGFHSLSAGLLKG
jgi:flavin reductase (DIM6/NTAB) family NADH-FMN oxidoreductase RutF